MKETESQKTNRPRKAYTILAVFIIGLFAVSSSYPIRALGDTPTTFSGRAFAVSVTTPLTGTLTFADTGQLPPQGGETDATVLSVQTQQAQADVLLSVTMGFDHNAKSQAAVADVTLLPGTSNQITADFLESHSLATCTGVSGDSEIVNLKLADQQITVTGERNQTISVGGVLTLVINEQVMSSSDGTQSITVNALHVSLVTELGVIEVIVSSAHSDIHCGVSGAPMPKDFMTGGGYIVINGGRDNFGFVAGLKPGQTIVSGHLNYIDHSSGDHLQSVDVTSYTGSDFCRTFSGPGTVNGQSVTFTVKACDNAEPGIGSDIFGIQLPNDYSRSAALSGGNIQLHN